MPFITFCKINLYCLLLVLYDYYSRYYEKTKMSAMSTVSRIANGRILQKLLRYLLILAVVTTVFGIIAIQQRFFDNHTFSFMQIQEEMKVEEEVQMVKRDGEKYKSIFVPLQADPAVVCQVPKLDPFHPSIIKFISHERSLTCAQLQENMTYVDDNGYLRFNDSEFAGVAFLRRINVTDYTCSYKTFDRASGLNDNEMAFNAEKVLTIPVKLDEDFVSVRCTYNNQTFYQNIHAHPADKPTRIFAKPIDDQLSVLLMYIDSISHSVLQRNLPATFKYTSNVMKMIYFEGLNKIGDNSFPNMMAALTGKRAYNEQEGMMKELTETYNNRFDPWPLIWKRFAAKGYATTFNEDKPEWGMFHYGASGFTKKSFDYYYHIYWRALYEQHIVNSSIFCFGNEAKPRIFLDIAKRHLRMTNTTLQFMYNFYVDQSHDYVNEVERIDDDLVRFWREMFENGHLNQTVVLFASDHGHRFSGVRATIIGLLEERLPFLGIWFPDWLYERYPHLRENMRNNSKLLASTFDIHETLKDVLENNYEGQQRSLRNRGLSLLYPLPKNRTCQDAGIPDHYCTCIVEKDVDAANVFFKLGAETLVHHLNGLLFNYSSVCRPIILSNIRYIRQIDFDEKVKQGVKNYDRARRVEEELRNATLVTGTSIKPEKKSYRFGITTQPFEAQFESILRAEIVNETLTLWQVSGGVSRINSYRGLSDCVKDPELRKYCSCKNVVPK